MAQPLVNKILDKTGMKGTGVSTVPASVTSSFETCCAILRYPL